MQDELNGKRKVEVDLVTDVEWSLNLPFMF